MTRQPSRQARQRVADAFNVDALIRICSLTDFSEYAPRIDLPGRDRFYHYQNNGAPVLAVAHLDSVQSDGRCSVVETAGGLLACSGTLDDRLGAYVILELLPALGITCDLLLTTDEECGQSTAGDFDPPIEHDGYNWIIQFDRGGTDVVSYQYETVALGELVAASGARMDVGSYSDICELEHLGCAGLNWGVGYREYHSARAHAWLDDTFRMVARFVKFHRSNATTHLPHEPFDRWAEWDLDDTGARVDEFIAGDCGHEINLADAASYVVQDSSYRVCVHCGTAAA